MDSEPSEREGPPRDDALQASPHTSVLWEASSRMVQPTSFPPLNPKHMKAAKVDNELISFSATPTYAHSIHYFRRYKKVKNKKGPPYKKSIII
ncbi:hypothetical protein EVAR_94312_1 [Eumeta japonica]|uniref:Uncharacterized protein n=1 Tax=Eumeta variegata TaxID=151549 RepID=A0A4C1UFX3_EUMVA|nr:hypothetical protein EVAR_94312_1 [Eumeta japonica]